MALIMVYVLNMQSNLLRMDWLKHLLSEKNLSVYLKKKQRRSVQ